MKRSLVSLALLVVSSVAFAQTTVNLSNTTPAAPSGGVNVKFQKDGSNNFSAYVPPFTLSTVSTATYTTVAGDCTSIGNTLSFTYAGNVSVTLASASSVAGCKIWIKNLTGSGDTVTLTPSTGTIDGGASLTIYYPGDAQVQYDGTNWKAFGGYGVRGASTLTTQYSLPYVSSAGTLGQAAISGIPVFSGSAAPRAATVADLPDLPLFNSAQFYGDSIIDDFGATVALRKGVSAYICGGIMTMDCASNNSVGGTSHAQFQAKGAANFYKVKWLPTLTVWGTLSNDAANLSSGCTGTTSDNCAENETAELNFTVPYFALPQDYITMASTCTQTSGTWTADTTLPIFIDSTLTSPGTQMQTTSSGAVLTCTVNDPSAQSTKLDIYYQVANAQTGSYTVSVDSTSRTEPCTGATNWSSGPCGGTNISKTTTAFFGQEVTVTPASTHTVVITTANTNKVNIFGFGMIPPAGTAGINYELWLGPNANYGGTTIATNYDTLLANAVTKYGPSGDGLPIYFGSEINGTPGVDASSSPNGCLDVSATALYPGSTAAGHPNDWCHYRAAVTMVNAAKAQGAKFFVPGFNGMAASGRFGGPISIGTSPQATTDNTQLLSQFNLGGQAGAGISLLDNGTSSMRLTYWKDAGVTTHYWYNQNLAGLWTSTGWIGFGSLPGSFTSQNYVTHFGVLGSTGFAHGDGNTFPLNSTFSTTNTALTPTGIATGTIPAAQAGGAQVSGYCSVRYQQSTASTTVQFGMGLSNTPASNGLIAETSMDYGASSPLFQDTTITSTTTAAITAAQAPSATATTYHLRIQFTLYMTTSSEVLTLYGATGSGGTLSVLPGSYCTLFI